MRFRRGGRSSGRSATKIKQKSQSINRSFQKRKLFHPANPERMKGNKDGGAEPKEEKVLDQRQEKLIQRFPPFSVP